MLATGGRSDSSLGRLFEDRWASLPSQTWGFWARYSEANLLLTRKVGVWRDIRDFGRFGAGLVAGAARRDVSTLEIETAWRDKQLIVTRYGKWRFDEKSRGMVPRLCSLTPGSLLILRPLGKLRGQDLNL